MVNQNIQAKTKSNVETQDVKGEHTGFCIVDGEASISI